MTVVRPGSGLCNRLRVIGSAIKLAREVDAGLRIEWFRCPLRRWAALCGMRTGFSDLLESIDGVEVCERIKIRNDFPWNARIYSKRNPMCYDEDARHRFIEDVKRDPSGRRWLWTCFNFYSNDDFSWLRPVRAVREKVEEVTRKLGDNCIGVHIRRTDNRASIDCSPLSLFIERIENELEMDSAVRFFVASDDGSVRRALRERFGESVLFREKIGERYTIEGERDALVDLMLLSRTRKVYGSYWSSFSEVAAQIGRIPLEILVKSDEPLPEWIKS